jgi:hypothetical protein
MAFDLKKISFHFEAPNERDYVKKLLQQIEKEYKSIYKIATGDSIKENFDIEKALTDLENDPKFSEVRKIPYRDLISVRFNNFRIENITIQNFVTKEDFQINLLNLFDEIALDEKFQKRKSLIKEAFKLYELELFAGCLCLLYTQIEGIITDYLIFKKITITKTNNGKIIFPRNPPEKGNISGLEEKIRLGNQNKSIKDLQAYQFNSNENYKFYNERNNVLHGSCINNFTADKCSINFIWIDSILNSIKIELSK